MATVNFGGYFWELLILIILVSVVSCAAGGSHKPLTAKLKFKISGRNLIDQDGFSTTDGYVEVFYTSDGGKTVKRLGRTETVFDKRNPDWEKEFEFHFDRKLKQYLFFHVYDEDAFKFDDIGRVWINVADFVDKDQVSFSNLDEGGYLLIKGTEKPQGKSLRKKKGYMYANLPFKQGTPKSKKIKFTVTARGLVRNSNNHETLVISLAEGVNGGEKKLGKATHVTASFNPNWKKTFSVNWNRGKDQRLHFKIYDGHGEDSLKEKDKVGDVWVQVNDYVARGEKITVLLPEKGSLTMTKA